MNCCTPIEYSTLDSTAGVQDSSHKEVASDYLSLRDVQNVLGLAYFDRYLLRGHCRALQRSLQAKKCRHRQ